MAAKTQTEKSRYPSRYSPGGWVTAAQYIIETVLEQSARKQKKDLPVNFWNLPEWEALYKGQLRITYALLKKYSAKAILQVVQEKKIDNLRPNWVEPQIKQAQVLLDTVKTKEGVSANIAELRSQTVKIPEQRVKQTKLSKLMELDDG